MRELYDNAARVSHIPRGGVRAGIRPKAGALPLRRGYLATAAALENPRVTAHSRGAATLPKNQADEDGLRC